jgi:hypothetical protein
MDAAAQRAGLGENYQVEYIEAPLGWRQALAIETQALAARMVRALVPESQLMRRARRALEPLAAEFGRLSRFNDPRQVYYYCPCSVEQ